MTAGFRRANRRLAAIRELARLRQSFAFETTLASKSHARFLSGCRQEGYLVHLIYVWLNSPEIAIDRVADRVARGGHDVPADTIRRRYPRGFKNLFELYIPQADTWSILDNSVSILDIVADRAVGEQPNVYNGAKLALMKEQMSSGT